MSSETRLQMNAHAPAARLWPGREEERFTDHPASDFYETPRSDPYTYPAHSTGATSSPSQNYYRGHIPDPSRSRTTRTARKTRTRTTNPHQDCEHLERSNQRMAAVFWILAVCCVVVFLVYIVVIVVVFVSLSRVSSGDSAGEADDGSLCVEEEVLRQLDKNWDTGDQREIVSLQGAGPDFSRPSSSSSSSSNNNNNNNHNNNNNNNDHNKNKNKVCFSSLTWAPRIMEKIRSKVLDSVSEIEEKQKTITEIVNGFTGANNNGSICSSRETKTEAKGDSVRPEDAVFAHFFVSNENYTERPAVTGVRLVEAGQLLSKRVGVSIVNGKSFQIRRSGYYFVYTNLVFKTNSGIVQRVVKHRGGKNRTLLESTQGPVSFLQGVFKLQANDTLTVVATAHLLYQGNNKISYFGTYLIRT